MTNPGLTRAQWVGVLTVLLAVFVFSEGPIWPVTIAAWDGPRVARDVRVRPGEAVEVVLALPAGR